jgi:hypothetical protein
MANAKRANLILTIYGTKSKIYLAVEHSRNP